MYKRQVLRLADLYHCRAALLKERSPSCGSGQIYDGTFTKTPVSYTHLDVYKRQPSVGSVVSGCPQADRRVQHITAASKTASAFFMF